MIWWGFSVQVASRFCDRHYSDCWHIYYWINNILYGVELYLILVVIKLFNRSYISLIPSAFQFIERYSFLIICVWLKNSLGAFFSKGWHIYCVGDQLLRVVTHLFLSWHLGAEAGGLWVKRQFGLSIELVAVLSCKKEPVFPSPPKSLCSERFLLNLLHHHSIRAVQIDFRSSALIQLSLCSLLFIYFLISSHIHNYFSFKIKYLFSKHNFVVYAYQCAFWSV